MADPAVTLIASDKNKSSRSTPFATKVSERQSGELIIALCGPIGCGMKSVVEALKENLKENGYSVQHIRLSELMCGFVSETDKFKQFRELVPESSTQPYKRFKDLQTLGNKLREIENGFIAQLAVKEINLSRGSKAIEDGDKSPKSTALTKTAYIIDQLKHHEEASVLRRIYGNIFYLLGVLCAERSRIKNLKDLKIRTEQASELIQIDKNQNLDHGQKLEKTILMSDFFLDNSKALKSTTKDTIARFVNLIHTTNGITPTREEIGMYTAFSAALQSACLSRQVGAAIIDKDGNILATGKNDVPKFGGGLYSADNRHDEDHRCFNRGECFNDKYKGKLIDDLKAVILNHVDHNKAIAILEEVEKNERIRSIIEYSRSIHAEMDAIVSLSRRGVSIPKDTTLFTTTFPCHNCARHIIAAGISKVVFIEPYEKSLALELHDDSLTVGEENDKVKIAPFQGVAPRKYQSCFITNGSRKSDGRATFTAVKDASTATSELVDSYIEAEDQCVRHLETISE